MESWDKLKEEFDFARYDSESQKYILSHRSSVNPGEPELLSNCNLQEGDEAQLRLAHAVELVLQWKDNYSNINWEYFVYLLDDYICKQYSLRPPDPPETLFSNEDSRKKAKGLLHNLQWLRDKINPHELYYDWVSTKIMGREVNIADCFDVIRDIISKEVNDPVHVRGGVQEDRERNAVIVRLWSHMIVSGIPIEDAIKDIADFHIRLTGKDISAENEVKRLKKLAYGFISKHLSS